MGMGEDSDLRDNNSESNWAVFASFTERSLHFGQAWKEKSVYWMAGTLLIRSFRIPRLIRITKVFCPGPIIPFFRVSLGRLWFLLLLYYIDYSPPIRNHYLVWSIFFKVDFWLLPFLFTLLVFRFYMPQGIHNCPMAIFCGALRYLLCHILLSVSPVTNYIMLLFSVIKIYVILTYIYTNIKHYQKLLKRVAIKK